MVSETEFADANLRADERQRRTPRIVQAKYDRRSRCIVLVLDTRVRLAFSPRDAQGLEDATPDQLSDIEISPSGLGIHFPATDADLYLPSLLKGFLGSSKWTAAHQKAS
ncbi:MAG TPA: DUF2442 domain-containing protein [Acidobacteriaceae bacterium]|jgi:hypothetical protein|nr:DUF2442 domain-containing protein [Acidobacteriaceae bacterium]